MLACVWMRKKMMIRRMRRQTDRLVLLVDAVFQMQQPPFSCFSLSLTHFNRQLPDPESS